MKTPVTTRRASPGATATGGLRSTTPSHGHVLALKWLLSGSGTLTIRQARYTPRTTRTHRSRSGRLRSCSRLGQRSRMSHEARLRADDGVERRVVTHVAVLGALCRLKSLDAYHDRTSNCSTDCADEICYCLEGLL